jgi:hypothetical protein
MQILHFLIKQEHVMVMSDDINGSLQCRTLLRRLNRAGEGGIWVPILQFLTSSLVRWSNQFPQL